MSIEELYRILADTLRQLGEAGHPLAVIPYAQFVPAHNAGHLPDALYPVTLPAERVVERIVYVDRPAETKPAECMGLPVVLDDTMPPGVVAVVPTPKPERYPPPVGRTT